MKRQFNAIQYHEKKKKYIEIAFRATKLITSVSYREGKQIHSPLLFQMKSSFSTIPPLNTNDTVVFENAFRDYLQTYS